jgi:hypothetical protein
MDTLHEQALKYCIDSRFSVIPCKKDKKPLIQWEEYQKRIAEPEEVDQWWKKYPEANIGIVTGKISNLAVIDIDTREGEKNLLEKFPEISLKDNPVVTTPRGGKHIYFKCPDDKIRNNAGAIPGCDFRANGGYVIAPPSMNTAGNRYEWTNITELHDLLPSYIAYLNSYICSYKENVTDSVTLFEKGRRDNDLFHIGNQLKKGGSGDEEIRQTMYFIGRNCNPPLPDREIEIKYQSVIKFDIKRDVNLTDFVLNWINQTDGVFSIKECNKSVTECNIPYQNLRVIFKRLKDKGIIQRFGEKDGYYIKVNDELEKIDWMSAPTEKLNLKYPFYIEELFETYPKNIIVIAGVPDSGKTAFLLNFVKENMKKHEIHYFSSEMGSIEFRNRLSKFNIPLSDWTFNSWERVADFGSVIKPNAINIIDFLEMTTDFWKVSQYMQEVHNKLNKGIALIAIQKNPGADVGLGGYRGMEKPRLYLNMDRGKIKIVKAKNWKTEINPNNLCKDFKIVQGCEFITIAGDWYKEAKDEVK